MTVPRRSICLSVNASTCAAARAAVRDLPPAVALVELRADLLDASELGGGAWTALPVEFPRDWVFTYRTRGEGGGAAGEVPRGLRARALEAGFRWIDVEAGVPARPDEVPASAHWASSHRDREPASPSELRVWWEELAAVPAALHKLVVPAAGFAVNRWILDLVGELARAGAGPFSVFAMEAAGHPSRILGGLAGNAVTFCAAATPSATAPGQPDLDQLLNLYRFPEQPGDPPLYGVLGNPVSRSRSPRMHNRVLAGEGLGGLYLPFESTSPDQVVDWMREGGPAGMSVTAPFKKIACALAERVEARAQHLGAANTLWVENGIVHAANTDRDASAAVFERLRVPRGAPVAVIGAGGAARAVIDAAVGAEIRVSVFGRSDRGREDVLRLGAVWGGRPAELHPAACAAVVNATPLGIDGTLPAAIAGRDWGSAAVVDLNYADGATGWEILARERGLAFVGGVEFLARQAVGQFRRWTGRDVSWERFAEAAA